MIWWQTNLKCPYCKSKTILKKRAYQKKILYRCEKCGVKSYNIGMFEGQDYSKYSSEVLKREVMGWNRGVNE